MSVLLELTGVIKIAQTLLEATHAVAEVDTPWTEMELPATVHTNEPSKYIERVFTSVFY